jgi:molybdate transport system ATP-binding protein
MITVDIEKKIKTYEGYELLQVKTIFPNKSITTIHGPSGSGKTTFLRVLAGLAQPDKGKIEVNGDVWLDIQQDICLSPQLRAAGFVFQDYALFPSMTVYQHLQYSDAEDSYIERLLALGKMESFKNHKPNQLSGGQQQRLAIMRALSARPKVLLMDEPFSSLDSKLKASLLPELRELIIELGITCIVVTHYPFETEHFSEYTYEFDNSL